MGLTQSNNDETIISPNDVVGRVLGPEHYGRVRLMGIAAVPSNTFMDTSFRLTNLSHSSSNAATSSSNVWQEKYTNLESALKAYILRKEGGIPEEFAGVFGSTTVCTFMKLMLKFVSMLLL